MKLVWSVIIAILLFPFSIDVYAQITDGGFEIWQTNSNLSYWNEEDNLPINLMQESQIIYSGQYSVRLGQNDFLRQSFSIFEGAHALTVMVYPGAPGACQVTMEMYDVHGRYITAATIFSTGIGSWEMLSLNPSFPQGVTTVRLLLTNHSPALAYFDEMRFDNLVPVELFSFTATILNRNAIRLQWQTASETENFGFYLYRSTGQNDNFIRINDTIIMGAGTAERANEYHYIDNNVRPGSTYRYALVDVSFNGDLTTHAPIQIEFTEFPQNYILTQCYPNPFNPETNIGYELKNAGHVSLTVYDVRGNLVTTLVDARQDMGQYMVKWDGTDATGLMLASGTYFYTLMVNDYKMSCKMILMR